MTKKINIAILDDHQIVIDGLKLLLENEPNMSVVLESTNGFKLLEKLKKFPETIDILLLDLMMPEIDGYETALMLQNDFPEIKVIILSMNNDGKIVSNLIKNAGLRGFLSKSVNKTELLKAITLVDAGETYFPVDILTEVRAYEKQAREGQLLSLTDREIEIIKMIDRGLSNKEIASHLFISDQTVSTHRKNIFRKTGTRNVPNLLNLVKKYQIV